MAFSFKIVTVSKNAVQGVLVVAIIVSAYFIGNLTAKVQYLQSGAAPAAGGAAAQQPAQPTVSLDTIKGVFKKNVIKFGDASKKLLLVEVADPSCPFCHIAAGKNFALNSGSPQF